MSQSNEAAPHQQVTVTQNSTVKAVPLRIWLVVLVLFITGAGLVGSSLAVSSIMRGFIYSRVDVELNSAVQGWASSSEIFRGDAAGRPPTDYSVIKIFPDGSTFAFNGSRGQPDLSEITVGGGIQTVTSQTDSANSVRWRAISEVDDNQVTTVVAKTLSREDNIIARLNGVQAVITLVVLVTLAFLAYYLVYRALTPLREVERTASKIAEGDLDRRVPQWPAKTEVGQLAYALNIMLQRLQESLEESQRKEEQMRRFVGDASHELRTPLTSVRGYAELYRSGATDDVDLVLDKIDGESKRMSVLVEDLLALTRAEGQHLESADVDMLETALAVASSARAAYPGRHVDVINETSSVPVVVGDPGRLHQVLLNLVTNGIRHGGPEAEITMRLHFADTADAGDADLAPATPNAPQLVIEVTDNGVGMDEEDLEHIFERFYRADASRSRASGGSGLGLAITKSLVEKHGGSITVTSTKGVGSSFRIVLPARDDSVDQDSNAWRS